MNTPINVLLHRKVSSAVHMLPPSATVIEAVNTMNQHKVGSVLVTSARRLVGIFTERDVLTRVVGLGRDPGATTLSEVMTHHPVTIRPDITVDKVMEIVTVYRVRRLPVLDEFGTILGLISVGDLMAWLVEVHQAEATNLREYIRGGESAG
jgi:CBS domain-containing protein